MVLGIPTTRKKPAQESALIRLFGAVGDATRFKLIQIMSKKEELCVSELAKHIGITTAGASQHLKILEQAGLVVRHRYGQKICYAIDRSKRENKKLLDLILES
jgi:DNA-binding transcriptional ArsR family regulator